MKNHLIEKIKTLSEEQLELVAALINQFELSSDFGVMTVQESQAMAKWKYLLKHDREMDKAEPLSDDELNIVRQVLSRQNKTRPVGLAKGEVFIADDFNEPLPDEIIDLFYQ